MDIRRLLRILVNQYPDLPAHMNRGEKLIHLLDSDLPTELEKELARIHIEQYAQLSTELGYTQETVCLSFFLAYDSR